MPKTCPSCGFKYALTVKACRCGFDFTQPSAENAAPALPRQTNPRPFNFVGGVLLGLLICAAFAVIPGLVSVALNGNRVNARSTWTMNNLKQMGLAAHGFNDVYKRLPPGYGNNIGPIGPPVGPTNPMMRAVHVHLLPYIEQENLFKLWAVNPTGLNPASGDTSWLARNPPGFSNNAFDNGPLQTPVHAQVITPFTANSDVTADDYRGVQNFAANFRVFCNNELPKFNVTTGNASWPAEPATATSGPGLFLPSTDLSTTGADSKPNYYDGAASVPRTFNIDGTSNVILFATRYAVCGTKTYGLGTLTTGNSALNTPGLAGGSFYWAPPNDTRGAFFGHTGATVQAHGNNVTNPQNIPTFQLAPTQLNCHPMPSRFAQSFGTGGLQVCLADASCRNISPSISVRTWNLALQPNDGQRLPQDWSD